MVLSGLFVIVPASAAIDVEMDRRAPAGYSIRSTNSSESRADAASDREEIFDLLDLYALAMDTQHWDLFDRIFMPDAIIDYGEHMRWDSLESFKKAFAEMHEPLDSSTHIMGNQQVRIRGSEAHAFTYGQFRLIRALKGKDGNSWDATGWYDDRLVRTDRGWRIASRRYRLAWWGGNPLVLGLTAEEASSLKTYSIRNEAEDNNIIYLRKISE